jgi:hypothetical protein
VVGMDATSVVGMDVRSGLGLPSPRFPDERWVWHEPHVMSAPRRRAIRRNVSMERRYRVVLIGITSDEVGRRRRAAADQDTRDSRRTAMAVKHPVTNAESSWPKHRSRESRVQVLACAPTSLSCVHSQQGVGIVRRDRQDAAEQLDSLLSLAHPLQRPAQPGLIVELTRECSHQRAVDGGCVRVVAGRAAARRQARPDRCGSRRRPWSGRDGGEQSGTAAVRAASAACLRPRS